MEALKYLIQSIVIGCLSVWASENFFWMIPPPDLDALGFILTLIAYSIAAAVALSAVIWAGLGGLPGAFLAGAILGYMSEGVIVGTIYQALPVLLVWTPLAWHALLTGGIVIGIGRAGFPPRRMALVWAGLGIVGAYWAQFWPVERGALPDLADFAIYIIGFGLFVPIAHLLMDMMGSLPQPRRWVLLIAPVIALSFWILQSVLAPSPTRIVLPLLMVLILWMMRRLGSRRPVALGPALPLWRHFLFMIAPLLTVGLGWIGWSLEIGAVGANWVIAVATSLTGLTFFMLLVWRAARRPAA